MRRKKKRSKPFHFVPSRRRKTSSGARLLFWSAVSSHRTPKCIHFFVFSDSKYATKPANSDKVRLSARASGITEMGRRARSSMSSFFSTIADARAGSQFDLLARFADDEALTDLAVAQREEDRLEALRDLRARLQDRLEQVGPLVAGGDVAQIGPFERLGRQDGVARDAALLQERLAPSLASPVAFIAFGDDRLIRLALEDDAGRTSSALSRPSDWSVDLGGLEPAGLSLLRRLRS